MVGAAKFTVLNNQFKDLNYSNPDAAYEKACKDLQTGEWEIEMAGVEMIITLARKDPEVNIIVFWSCNIIEL